MSCVNEQKHRTARTATWLARALSTRSTLWRIPFGRPKFLPTLAMHNPICPNGLTASATTTMAIASPRPTHTPPNVISLRACSSGSRGTGIYLTVEHEHRTIYCYVNASPSTTRQIANDASPLRQTRLVADQNRSESMPSECQPLD